MYGDKKYAWRDYEKDRRQWERDFEHDRKIARRIMRRTDWFIIGAAIVALVLVLS
jgi:hypothetical protein